MTESENKQMDNKEDKTNSQENKKTEELLKPEESDKDIKKPTKKSHKGLWTLIILFVIIILLPAMLIGYTGLFQIPVLSDIFGSNKPIDLGIESSEAALSSAMEKTPWTLEGEPSDYTIFNKKEFIGSVEIDHQLTSEELTSFLNEYLQSDPYVSDVQVKMIEGGVEASGMVNKYINAPAYVKVGLTKLNEKEVKIDLDEVKVGRLPVPSSIVETAEEYINDLVADRMAQNEGFSIETLEYHDGYDIFKGTFPATVKTIEGPDWWAGI